MVCERKQTGTFAICTVGGGDCVLDIVVIDIATGESVRNLTQSIANRDNFPAVTAQVFTDLPFNLD